MGSEWPRSWRRAKLGDIADVNWGDTSVTKKSYVTSGYVAYSATGPDGFLPYYDYDCVGVVVSAIGAQCGRTWLAKRKWSCIKNTIRFWSTTPEVDTEFLYWITRDPSIWPKRGSAQPFISQGDARAVEIAYPPLPEQRAIAHILGTLDDKIEMNRRMNETLEAMAQALFKSWFVDFDPVVVNAIQAGNPIPEKFAARAAHYRQNPDALGLPSHIQRLFPERFVDSELGPIPEGWEVGPLSQIAVLRAKTINPNREPETIWEHYSIPAFDKSRMPKFERGIDIKSGKYKVPSTSVLASKLNPQFPRVWLPDVVSESRAICSTEFMPFVPVKGEWRSYLYELLKSDPIQERIRSAATGSTGSRQRVKPKIVVSMPTIVAPTEILDAFCDQITFTHNLVLSNQRESQTLAALRDTLLPKLISGELRVPDVEEFLAEAEI